MFYKYSFQGWYTKDGVKNWYTLALGNIVKSLCDLCDDFRWRVIENETNAIIEHGKDNMSAVDYYLYAASGHEPWFD
ncbi:MAG: hypothetical protein FWG36_02445 [Oscillospiraceae bacterium]|nr:hypothetical protein [Oscillospiraceae bacterium]